MTAVLPALHIVFWVDARSPGRTGACGPNDGLVRISEMMNQIGFLRMPKRRAGAANDYP